MVAPLHIKIAMHYHCHPGQYEMVLTNETRRECAEDLVRAGLLRKEGSLTAGPVVGFVATEGLAVWIEAICSVPFPVQQWVIPGAHHDRTDR